MENSNKIVPPHLNAEVYRSDTTNVNTVSYLEYLYLHPENGVLIGFSELTGRYWNGGASIYNSVNEAQKNHNEGKKSINLASGTTDGCFIENSNKVLLCEDKGTVSVWSTNNDDAWKLWNEEASVSEHDDGILAVDCIQSGIEYVTAGADGNVKVWDINEMLCIRNYLAAHSLAIYGVSVRPQSSSSFATCSMDEYITLWDDNISKPVLDLAKNNCSVRCLEWIDNNKLLFGDEGGILSMVDIRTPEKITKLLEFPAAVHKIKIQPESEKVAICCDNIIVTVCDISSSENVKVIYHDRHMHSNYVRGLAWDLEESKKLHSLGWDGEIKTHNVIWE